MNKKDIINDRLNVLLRDFSFDPNNADTNYFIGLEYEGMGHTAAAISYFLRCADRTHNPQLAYECMLKVGLCLERQGRRGNSVRGAFQHSICLLPKRPEAYFLLARHYERIKDYPTGYMYADLALKIADLSVTPLLSWVEYPGKFGLVFEKAVCAWWWGKPQESRYLFLDLWNNYVLDELHFSAVETNLKQLGVMYTPRPNLKAIATVNIPTSTEIVPDENKMDVVLQGPYLEETDEVIRTYLEVPFVNSIIVSCWNEDETPIWSDKRVIIHKNKKPDFFGTDNRNLQIVSSRNGVALAKTKYVAKMRTDQCYDMKSMMNMYKFFMESKNRDSKIFVAGYYGKLQYHPRDHIFWGLRLSLISLFDCPLEINGLGDRVKIPKDKLWKYYNHFTRSETFIAAPYIAKFNPEVYQHLIEPEKYLYDNAPNWGEAHRVSSIWFHRIFQSFPAEGIDLKWRRKGWEHYPYNQQYGEGERWAENDPPDDLDMGNNDEEFHRNCYEEVVRNKIYERFHRVEDGQVVVDIGANVGFFPYSIRDRKLNALYCIEPAVNICESLSKNLTKHGTNFKKNVVCNYGIASISSELKTTEYDHIFGVDGKPSTFTGKTFKDFITENRIKCIDFLKVDCEGGEYEIFTKENYDFITKNVKYIAGEWHFANLENSIEKFIDFKNTYLVGRTKPYKVFEPYGWKDISEVILDDSYVHSFYNWWVPRNGAELIIYMDNR